MNPLITLYKYNTAEVRAIIDPDDKSAEQCGIMRGDLVNLTFKRADYIDFQIGDYGTIYDRPYRINRPPVWNKNFKREYDYTLTLEGRYFHATRAQYLTLNAHNTYTEGKFSQTGKPVDFLRLAVANMQRAFPTEGWTMGQVVDGDYKTLDFDSENCLQALSKLADQYKTEFTIVGTTINLIQLQPASGITLEFGKGKALFNLGRNNQEENANIITRLYAYGSTKNLGDNYRDGAPRLRMAEALYVDKNVNRFGIYEGTIVFDGTNGLPDIFPTRIGTVTSVDANTVFTDNAIDFNINDHLLPGVTAKVTFNTGLLAGITFEISNFNNGTKTFTINANTDDQTAALPSDTLKPVVGDKYVLIDITLPLSYYNDAEARLKAAALKYINDKGLIKPVFPVKCNPLYFKRNGTELNLGYSYNLKDVDTNTNRQIRLVSYSRSLRNRFIYNELTLSDTVVPQLPIVKLFNGI